VIFSFDKEEYFAAIIFKAFSVPAVEYFYWVNDSTLLGYQGDQHIVRLSSAHRLVKYFLA